MSTTLRLPLMMFGDVSLRVIIIKDLGQGNYKIIHTQPRVVRETGLQIDEMPIFLARDVCRLIDDQSRGSGVMTRFTRKMHNYRLNTKVHFKDIAVDGINNSSVINFVSIAAVYMALFTGSNTQVQKLLAPSLMGMWEAHCDKQLPENLHYLTGDDDDDRQTDFNCGSTFNVNRTKLFDELLKCVDSCGEEIEYTTDLRSLLNSYRSLCLKLETREFSEVLRKEEELIQSLISHDCLQAPGIKEAMVEAASGWIGDEFRHLRSSIQQRVNKFKADNIKSMGKLPSSQETCNIFPKAMIVLFEHWLSSYNDLAGSADYDEPNSKRPRTSEINIYPFIQLLLEFANNTLISGVAHVVYTQLLKDPT